MKLVNEQHRVVMEYFREKLDEKGILWMDCSDPLMIRTKFFLNKNDKEPWSVICGSGSMGGDDGLLEVWVPKEREPSGGYTVDEIMEMIEKEKTMPTKEINAADVFFGKLDGLTSDEPETINLTMESPQIEYIQPNRYELLKDVIKWAVTHDKTVSISEVNEMLSVTIHNDDEVEE